MEIKRKKIRRSALFQENADIQAKLDFEVRMREGAYKLLRACSKREPMLSASKNLLTCNARIEAYMGHMQETKEKRNLTGDRRSISGRFLKLRLPSVAGLRIPLMWKDQDHFNNRGSSRRVAVFCVMRMGCQVVDTKMAVVDRSVTDVCFEEVAVFSRRPTRRGSWRRSCGIPWARSGALCRIPPTPTPSSSPTRCRRTYRLPARTLSALLSGVRSCESHPGAGRTRDVRSPSDFVDKRRKAAAAAIRHPRCAEYHLLAYSTLTLPAAECSFQSHSLVVLQNSDWSSWLPLYGNLCCRLAAQPACMTQRAMAGYLDLKVTAAAFWLLCTVRRAGVQRDALFPLQVKKKKKKGTISTHDTVSFRRNAE
uniref:Rhotekin 2 n=1 Tax=Hippocampus comes TaxID=109280 RepID=A0A3Q3D323_HIPCM